MRTFIINVTLLALCYSNTFQPFKGHPQGAPLIHFHKEINKYVQNVKFSFLSSSK